MLQPWVETFCGAVARAARIGVIFTWGKINLIYCRLMIQTRRNNYVVEIKRQGKIDRGIISEVAEKVKKLATPKGKSARAVLVYDGKLAPSVETDGFFDVIVPFRDLLGM